ADEKESGKEVTHSLPLSMYTAPGGLRQGRGRAAQSTVRGQNPTDGSGEMMQGHAVVIAGRGPTGLVLAGERPFATGRGADGLLRVGFPGDGPDAGRGRWWQGRAPGGAVADRRHPRAGWLLRDDGRLPADHGGSAVDRRSARSAVGPEPGRPGGGPHAPRGGPPAPRRDPHPRGS